MKDFAAIDFETANGERSSVCSVGIVIVRDGVVREKIYRLIRPFPNYYSYWNTQVHNYYSYWNTQVHGLTRQDTDRAPEFPTVWQEVAPRLEGLPLVAHNSPFDEGCLRAAFKAFGMGLSVWAILTMPSIARVVPLDVPSASSCPTTSFRRWPPDAATT